MPQCIGVGFFENRAGIAVDDDRGGGRRVPTRMGFSAPRAAGQMDMPTVMMPSVRCTGGEGESRKDRGKNQNAIAKPVPGLDPCPTHYAPRP